MSRKGWNFAPKPNAMETKFFNINPGTEEVSILLYGDVGNGEPVDSGRVVSELLSLASQYKKIAVRINSNGGDVFSGIAIYNALRTSSADITIYVDGVAASIAAIVALCGKPLYMSPYAKLMLHSVSGGAWGNSSALRQTAETMEQLQGDLAKMVAGRCNMKPEDVAARYFDEKDHWIDAQEALSLGLIDGIYDMDGEEPPTDSTEAIYHYFNNRLARQSQKRKDMALIDDIKKVPTFNDKADESAVLAHLNEVVNQAAKVESLERANTAYKQQLDALKAKELEAIVDKAVAEGKIVEAQKASFLKLLNSDRASAEELLANMKPTAQPRVVDFIQNGAPAAGSMEAMSWDELDKAGKLAELKDANFTLFKQKYQQKFGVAYE